MSEETPNGEVQPRTYANRDMFLASEIREVRYKEVDIPCFGWICIRSVNDRELTRFQQYALDKNNTPNKMKAAMLPLVMMVELLVDSVTHATYLKESDIPKLKEIDAAIIDNIVYEIRQHIGIRDETEIKNS